MKHTAVLLPTLKGPGYVIIPVGLSVSLPVSTIMDKRVSGLFMKFSREVRYGTGHILEHFELDYFIPGSTVLHSSNKVRRRSALSECSLLILISSHPSSNPIYHWKSHVWMKLPLRFSEFIIFRVHENVDKTWDKTKLFGMLGNQLIYEKSSLKRAR